MAIYTEFHPKDKKKEFLASNTFQKKKKVKEFQTYM